MHERPNKDKRALRRERSHALQLIFAFAYAAHPQRGAVSVGGAASPRTAPGAPLCSYQDALLARVRHAFAGATPYAVSLAARTDVGVAADLNFCSLRLRLPQDWGPSERTSLTDPMDPTDSTAQNAQKERTKQTPETEPTERTVAVRHETRTVRRLEAALAWVANPTLGAFPVPGAQLADGDHDGLRNVRGWSLVDRTMGRAIAGAKHYAYALRPAHPVDGPGPGAAALAAASTLTAAFSAGRYFHRYCQGAAARADKARRPRPPCQVTLQRHADGALTLHLVSQALLRHQARHLAHAVRQVLDAPEALPAFLAALAPPTTRWAPSVGRAAPAASLRLCHVALPSWLLAQAPPAIAQGLTPGGQRSVAPGPGAG